MRKLLAALAVATPLSAVGQLPDNMELLYPLESGSSDSAYALSSNGRFLLSVSRPAGESSWRWTLRDIETGATQEIYRELTHVAERAVPAVSDDGRWVLFGAERLQDVIPTLPGNGIFGTDLPMLKDVDSGVFTFIAWRADGSIPSQFDAFGAEVGSFGLSADGAHAVFVSDIDGHVADDTNGIGDAFVYDRAADTLVRVSVDEERVPFDEPVRAAQISDDGRFIVMTVQDTDEALQPDWLWIHDRETGRGTRAPLIGVQSFDVVGDHAVVVVSPRFVDTAPAPTVVVELETGAVQALAPPPLDMYERHTEELWATTITATAALDWVLATRVGDGGSWSAGDVVAPTVRGDGDTLWLIHVPSGRWLTFPTTRLVTAPNSRWVAAGGDAFIALYEHGAGVDLVRVAVETIDLSLTVTPGTQTDAGLKSVTVDVRNLSSIPADDVVVWMDIQAGGGAPVTITPEAVCPIVFDSAVTCMIDSIGPGETETLTLTHREAFDSGDVVRAHSKTQLLAAEKYRERAVVAAAPTPTPTPTPGTDSGGGGGLGAAWLTLCLLAALRRRS